MDIMLSFCVMVSKVPAGAHGGFLSVHISQQAGEHGDASSPHFAGKAIWTDCELGQ